MSISYQSTRGKAPEADFRAVALGGLAPDGGLYVPKDWPVFSASDLAAMRDLPYAEIAFRVLRPFAVPAMNEDDLRRLLTEAYAAFDDPVVTPLKQLDERLWMLELFHGPTLAFKDLALQVLGRVFEHFLMKSGERRTVIGATSGDTGPAAIAGLAGRRNIDVFILYPHKGPSEIQRRQMTCVTDTNVHALAIEGSFDDCQALVKALFGDAALRAKYNFAAVNSINLFRILVQMVYYVAALVRLPGQSGKMLRPASFVVPTGNFGNIYAAYAAMKCGLPVSRLGVACNKNDVIARFFASGRMQMGATIATLSPSMDIQVGSNFERLLFDLCNGDGAQVAALMEEGRRTGAFAVSKLQLAQARQVFTAEAADDALTLETIAGIEKEHGYLLDPHSAVGVAVARKLAQELPEPVVVPATAHPAKFPETVKKAIGAPPPLPPALGALLQKPERRVVLPADIKAVEAYIEAKASR